MTIRRIIDFLINPDGEPKAEPSPARTGSEAGSPPDTESPPPSGEPVPTIEDRWTAKEVNVVSTSASGSPGGLPDSRCGISLRPWDDRFESVVCAWRNDVRFLHLWNSSRRLSIREEFWADICQMLKHTTFFLVHLKGKEDPIGCIYANRPLSKAQAFLPINVILTPENRKLGYGIAATYLFMHHLFEEFDISKVILDVYGWNVYSIKSTFHQAKLEGIRRNHVYWNGRLYDHYEFGVSREVFYTEIMKSAAWKKLIGK